MRIVTFFIAALLVASSASANERWAVYYGDKLGAESFADYDVIALDGEYTAPLATLKAQGKMVLGYISFGEAENYRYYFEEIKALGVLMEENPEWKGHFIIDIRKTAWKEYLIEDLLPAMLARGFDGVMFDTVDSPLHIKFKTDAEEEHMKQSSLALLCAVRAAFPDIQIMINRGLDIFPDVAPCINKLLAESTYTDLQLSSTRKPQLLSAKIYGDYVKLIKRSQKINPHLKVYTLDYWKQDDKETIRRIYKAQRSNGFIPYVSKLELDKIYKEPEVVLKEPTK